MSLTLPSQLLLQQELPDEALLVNPPVDSLSDHLNHAWTVSSFSYGSHQRFDSAGFKTSNIMAPEENKHDHVILFLPKSKARLSYAVDYAIASLKDGGELWFVGENKGGIKSVAKNLKEQFESISKLTSGKHCAIVSARRPIQSTPFDLSGYFTKQKNDLNLNLNVLPGIFSQSDLDKGTKILLDNLPRKIKGRVLDFGCGSGVIGLHLKNTFEAIEEVEMIDDDLLAIYSAQRNIEENKTEYCEAFVSNGLSDVEDRYHWIVSNPPFHQGVKTNYNVTEQFFIDAKSYLKLSGRLLIVANEFLSYEETLKLHFKTVTEIVRKNGFKVLVAEGVRKQKK